MKIKHLLPLLSAMLLLQSSLCSEEKQAIPEVVKKLHDAVKSDNPDYNGKGIFRLDKESRIIEVSFKDSPEVSNISALKGLPLEGVDLSGTNVSDLSPLQGMPLARIVFYRSRRIKDISPLSNARLNSVNFEQSGITDLSPLKGQPLEYARICCDVSDLSPLAGAPLKELDLDFAARLKDISPLKDAKELYDLRLDGTAVSDISAVRNLKGLKMLTVMDCAGIKDISAISDLNLETFLFTPKNLSEEQKGIIRGMKTLKILGSDWGDWFKKQTPAEFWKKYDAGEIK